jgi:hypothetical protein
MRLAVPCLDEVDRADVLLMRLAEFCGVVCDRVALESAGDGSSFCLSSAVREDECCLVVNPAVLRKWCGAGSLPPDLAKYLVARFRWVLVHNLDGGAFARSVIRGLSGQRLTGLLPVVRSELRYQVPGDRERVTGAFAGLEFGPVDISNDRVFVGELDSPAVRTLVAIDGRPFLVCVSHDHGRVLFVASRSMPDLDAPEPDFDSLRYFSRLVPAVMFLRLVFPADCWRPNVHHATLVIDDPLLRERYGFLNYARLLELMERYDFHTSIAFIPRNRLRTSADTAQMFRSRPDRYSLCIHGNDHTAGEFGSRDVAHLNAVSETAMRRMEVHRRRTAIPYDKVMVFPQGIFSEAAMRALKANNFVAAVNSHSQARGEALRLTVREYLQSAITGYGGFPLYLRKYVRAMTPYHAAFNLFFGQPVIVVDHHGIFKEADLVVGLVSQINALSPRIRWCNLQSAIESSFVYRETSNDGLEVLTYARCATVTNVSGYPVRCMVVKREAADIRLHQVLVGQQSVGNVSVADGRVTVAFQLPPSVPHRVSFGYANHLVRSDAVLGLWASLRVAMRRWASEFRDNYLSRTPRLLSVADSVQRRLLRADLVGPARE